MMKLVFSICALTVFLAGAVPPHSVAAEDSLADLQRHVENLRTQQQGSGSAETQRIFGKARAEAESLKKAVDAKQPTPTPLPIPDKTPRTHVRGGEGIPFPKPEEVYFDPHPPISFSSESKMAENIPPPQYTKPPRCESNETKREERPVDIGHKEEMVLSDTLYLSEEYVPVDVAEVYGTKAQIYPYGPKSGSSVYVRMRTHAVPCVPYRIRITNRAWYYDRGNNALKYYDKQPAGRGEYSKWMQQKLFLGK